MTQYHEHKLFKPEAGARRDRWGDLLEVCGNCRHHFLDHYNGRCPKDEEEKFPHHPA